MCLTQIGLNLNKKGDDYEKQEDSEYLLAYKKYEKYLILMVQENYYPMIFWIIIPGDI